MTRAIAHIKLSCIKKTTKNMVKKPVFLAVLCMCDWVLGTSLGPQPQPNQNKGYDVGVLDLCGCAEDYISSTEWSESGSGILSDTIL